MSIGAGARLGCRSVLSTVIHGEDDLERILIFARSLTWTRSPYRDCVQPTGRSSRDLKPARQLPPALLTTRPLRLANNAVARIMCTQKLWRALRQPGQPPRDVAEPRIHGVVLGSWATKVFRVHRRDLVVALDERTYLTVVFPLAPRTQFRRNFADALTAALVDLGVPDGLAHVEAAALDFEPFARLTNQSMAGTLNDLEFHCALELEYHDDLRRVQRNLNEMPHVNRDPCVPMDAVARVFSAARAQPAQLIH